ncbi:MAG: ribonuclease HI family protein [Acidimicrobiia bacterium]|nr:ribonuclease HI family protein [Acidimicrobiia bacterium]
MDKGLAVVIYCDGGSRGNPGPAAIGAVVYDAIDLSKVLACVSECIGVATNNVAEYRALIAGLVAAKEQGARCVSVRADSELVVRQLEGRYKVKNAGLRPLFEEARELLREFDEVDIAHVRREDNVDADALVNAALDAL